MTPGGDTILRVSASVYMHRIGPAPRHIRGSRHSHLKGLVLFLRPCDWADFLSRLQTSFNIEDDSQLHSQNVIWLRSCQIHCQTNSLDSREVVLASWVWLGD